MTRDEAIEAGARALRREQTNGLCELGVQCDLCDCMAPTEHDRYARTHAAAVIDAIGWRPESVVKAEALREAADAWQVKGWADDMPKGSSRPALIIGMAQLAGDFLRKRADDLERAHA